MEDPTFLQPLEGPELVFGLVGPVGADLAGVTKVFVNELRKAGYRTSVIGISKLLHEITEFRKLNRIRLEDRRIDEHMNAGNELRERLGRGDALALMSVAAIRNVRRKLTGAPQSPSSHTAYVLRSLKHPEEIATLRKVYGQGFTQISSYSPREDRLEELAKAIGRSRSDSNYEKYRSRAEYLIQRDEAEPENEKFGQNVRNTFPEADVFIDETNNATIKGSISRLIQIMFGNTFQTPTIDECGIYLAKAASLRSADLSRQVGAAIMTVDGEIISIGCNEVPRAGGGQYWPHHDPDGRDHMHVGRDPNYETKLEMLGELIQQLRPWFDPSMKNRSSQDLVTAALRGGTGVSLKQTQLMSVIEFGRVVHAEMAALTDAARLGRPVKGATLYSTTFPCHICARHLIAAGIERVVYIEPYPKSQAAKLYPDSISVDGAKGSGPLNVRFDPFVGIAPSRFREWFQALERKDTQGLAREWSGDSARPRLERLFPAYIQIEASVVASLNQTLQNAGFKPLN